jgi:hypothetical protein
MAWNTRWLVGVATLLLAPLVLGTPRAAAQSGQNGSILGHVFDQSGMPLKGIKVQVSSPTQIGGTKTTYTTEEGGFHFLALQPGSFEVRASAPKLKTVLLKEVRVGISSPADVNLILEVETAAEEVHVVERAPLISTSKAAVMEVFDLEMVESLPHGSRDSVHSQMVNDAAGGINGRIRGGAANQTIYTQDGFDIRGQVPTLKASAAYEVNTGGFGVDNPMASGGSINMVTKSGSNKYEFEFNATADSNQLRFFTDATDAAAPTYQYFINPLVSGPIIKDKLWFHFNTEAYYLQIGRQRDITGYLPDPATYRKWVPKGTLKLSWQVSPRHKIQSLTNFDFPNEYNRRPALGISLDAQEDRRGQRIFQGLIWEALLTNSLLFRSQVAFTSVPMHIFPRLCQTDPVGCDHVEAVLQRVPVAQEYQNNRLHQRNDQHGLQFQNRFDWFYTNSRFGDHSLQLKDSFYAEQDIRRVARPGDALLEYTGNFLDAKTIYYSNDPRLEPARFGWNISTTNTVRHVGTLSDSWRPTRHLTVTPAISHVWVAGSNSAGDKVIGQGAFAPAVSLAWDMTHDGRTVLRGSYNQYVDLDVGAVSRHTVDTPAQLRCRVNQMTGAFDQECEYTGGASNATFGLPCGPTGFDAQGQRCQEKLRVPRTVEYTTGAEREVVSGLALALDLFYRTFRNQYEVRETNRIWSNTGAALGQTGGYRNGRRETVNDLGTPDAASRQYRGATFGLTKREGRLKVKASYTLSKLEGNVLDGINNAWGDIPPRDVFLYGNLPDDHRHEIKTSATYQISPFISAGFRYRYYSGQPYNRLFRNDVTGNFDVYRARVGINPGNNLNDPGDDRELRYPDLQDVNVQLRVNLLPVLRQRVDLYVDVLNVLGLRTPTLLGVEEGRDFGVVRDRLEPLRIRLGLNYRY